MFISTKNTQLQITRDRAGSNITGSGEVAQTFKFQNKHNPLRVVQKYQGMIKSFSVVYDAKSFYLFISLINYASYVTIVFKKKKGQNMLENENECSKV